MNKAGKPVEVRGCEMYKEDGRRGKRRTEERGVCNNMKKSKRQREDEDVDNDE